MSLQAALSALTTSSAAPASAYAAPATVANDGGRFSSAMLEAEGSTLSRLDRGLLDNAPVAPAAGGVDREKVESQLHALGLTPEQVDSEEVQAIVNDILNEPALLEALDSLAISMGAAPGAPHDSDINERLSGLSSTAVYPQTMPAQGSHSEGDGNALTDIARRLTLVEQFNGGDIEDAIIHQIDAALLPGQVKAHGTAGADQTEGIISLSSEGWAQQLGQQIAAAGASQEGMSHTRITLETPQGATATVDARIIEAPEGMAVTLASPNNAILQRIEQAIPAISDTLAQLSGAPSRVVATAPSMLNPPPLGSVGTLGEQAKGLLQRIASQIGTNDHTPTSRLTLADAYASQSFGQTGQHSRSAASMLAGSSLPDDMPLSGTLGADDLAAKTRQLLASLTGSASTGHANAQEGREAPSAIGQGVGSVPVSSPSATSAGVTATTPPTLPASLSTPLTHPAWPREMSQQLALFSQRGGEQQIKMSIHPAELGPLTITLKMGEQGTQAHFLSNHAQVRQSVEQAIPQLREALAEQGINLGDTSVGEQRQQHTGGNDDRPKHSSSQGALAGAGDVPHDESQEMTLHSVILEAGLSVYA